MLYCFEAASDNQRWCRYREMQETNYFPNSDSLELLTLTADGAVGFLAAGLGRVCPGVSVVFGWCFGGVSVVGGFQVVS